MENLPFLVQEEIQWFLDREELYIFLKTYKKINNYSDLTNLQTLSLYNNQLTTLPESIGNLTNLQTLSLSHNQLTTASLPKSIGNLTNLRRLNLYCNQLA